MFASVLAGGRLALHPGDWSSALPLNKNPLEKKPKKVKQCKKIKIKNQIN